MADDGGMLASAVMLPEEEDEQTTFTPPDSRKRRQSSVTSETAKRPRLDSRASADLNPSREQNEAQSNIERRDSRTDDGRGGRNGASREEDRRRGKRLFGGVLSALSQGGRTNKAQQKREEVEKRQRERIKAQEEEDEEEKQKRLAKLRAVREREQEFWDGESAIIRRKNRVAMANFLQTRTKPPLYYRPWQLLPEQERQIEQQVEDARRDSKSGDENDNAEPGTGASHDKTMDDRSGNEAKGELEKDGKDRNGAANDAEEKDDGIIPKSASEEGDHGAAREDKDEAEEHEGGDGHSEDQVIY